jgi:hypothetical protein
MLTPSILEDLDVLEDVTADLVPTRINFPFGSLTLQELKEVLGNGIVMAIASAAHAALQIIQLEKRLLLVASMLARLIGVDDNLALGL